MLYLQANIRKQTEEKLYRMYMTESVKNINEILANRYTGSYMNKSWTDLLKRPKKTESAQEIRERIKRKLREMGG